MKTSKEMSMNAFNKAIEKVREKKTGQIAAYNRGLAHGLATSMFFSEKITLEEYCKLCDIICDTLN